jgi:preprotein translocase subunit Sec61beta
MMAIENEAAQALTLTPEYIVGLSIFATLAW